MQRDEQSVFEARKMPVQARSAVTVEAIAEATIQVLLSHGMDRLTTTRVAERAGVSVGTLYQYYPNKQALLFAVLETHMGRVAQMVEDVCLAHRHEALDVMVKGVVEAFVDAKMERTDISMALYQIAAEVDGAMLGARMRRRLQKALETMLATAPGVTVEPMKFAVEMVISTMSGATRGVLEAGASPAAVKKLREHLVVMCREYLVAVTC